MKCIQDINKKEIIQADRKEETQETPTKREELQTFCQDSVSYNKIDFVGREGDALSKL